MHYKNGREAKEGDAVITKNYNGKAVAGVAYNLREAESCNCDVAITIPGGVTALTCQNLNTMFHAEDALACIDAEWAKSAAAIAAP